MAEESREPGTVAGAQAEMAEESREPGTVAGAQAEEDALAPAAGEPAVVEPAVLVPGAREPDAADEHAVLVPGAGEPDAADEHAVLVPGARQPDAADEHAVLVPGARQPDAADDERAELERLRAEVRELREEGRPPGEKSPRARGRWRAPVSAVVITLGCVLALVSVLAVWAANQVSNTDRYVANMAPLIREPAIQNALSARITSEIENRLDVGALVSSTSAELANAHLPRLSTLLNNFSGPITSGVNNLVATTVSRAVASPAVATLWDTANRTAHAGVVKVLSGQGNGSVDVVNGEVVLSLGPLITQVKQDLVARGITIADKIPTVNSTFPLFAAPNLSKAQQGYRLLTTLKWVLPFLSIALLAAGIWIARRHRRALIGAALGLAASMLVLAIALAIARAIYLNSVPPTVLPGDAAAVLYDTLVRFIRDGLRVLLLIGLVVAAGAFLTGPSSAAVATRRAVGKGIGWLRDRGDRAGLHSGPVGDWTFAHKRLLRIGAIAVAALIFVFSFPPSVALVIWLVVLLLVVLGIIELLGGRPAHPASVPE
jgi:hypothetical protein